MLYVTTRSDGDVYTAHRALQESRGVDGGLYLPFQPPHFDGEELETLLQMPFHGCIAEVLNRLFPVKLTAIDVEFAMGRRSVQLKNLGRRTIMAELWHNPEGCYAYLEGHLTKLMGKENTDWGSWPRIAVRIAIWFGMFAEARRAGFRDTMDVSVVSGDFAAPISAWYGRLWGLPIGTIVCCCNENNTLWDLFRYGQMRTDEISIPTDTPDGDITLPTNLERLVYAYGGSGEVRRYLDALGLGKPYHVPEDMLEQLRKGMYVSVISGQRMKNIIPSVWKTHAHLLSPYGALAYGGLLDYRATADVPRYGLVLEERSPDLDQETVAASLGVEPKNIRDYLMSAE